MPPYTAWMVNGVASPRSRASAAICTTSSRVGAMTSARGAAGRPGRCRARRRVKIVMRNAAVLPVPVCACPATSRPPSVSGSTFSWIGVQCVNPARWGARTSAHAGGARRVGEQPARRAGALSHLRPRDQHRGGASDPPPPRQARHGPAGAAMGDRGGRGALGPSEPRLPVLTGRAWAFADDLAAADILPARFAALAAAETARRLFADLDGTLAARIARGDVLVAGVNLRRGAGGPAAAGALAAAGVIAVAARTFAAGFADALLAAAAPPLEVDAPAMFHTGQRLRVNLEAGVIANLSSGDRLPVRNLTEDLLAALRARLGR